MLPVAKPPFDNRGAPSYPSSIPTAGNWKTVARRLFTWRLIDWDFVTTQLALNIVNPKRCYEFASYRKQTRQSYAKDDPGVFLVNIVQVLICGLAYGLSLLPQSSQGLSPQAFLFGFIIWPVCLFTGVVLAGATGLFYLLRWYGRTHSAVIRFPLVDQERLVELLGRRLLKSDMTVRKRKPNTSTAQDLLDREIEWLYCFDVMNNILFVFVLVAFAVQLLFLPVVLPSGEASVVVRIVGCCVSSGFMSVAAIYMVFHAALAISVLSPLVADLSVLFFLPLAVILCVFIVLIPLQVSATHVMLKTTFELFL